MGGKLTAIPSSNGEAQRGESESLKTPSSSREVFDNVFPSYLAMGMTYDEFYHKDHTLAASYRKAFELQRERRNVEMWQMGAYIYQSVSRVAPLLVPFNKHPKAEPYLDKPIPFYEKESETETQQKAIADKGFAYMQSMMMKVNKKFGK